MILMCPLSPAEALKCCQQIDRALRKCSCCLLMQAQGAMCCDQQVIESAR